MNKSENLEFLKGSNLQKPCKPMKNTIFWKSADREKPQKHIKKWPNNDSQMLPKSSNKQSKNQSTKTTSNNIEQITP